MATKQATANHAIPEEKDRTIKLLSAANAQLTEALIQYLLSIPPQSHSDSRLTIHNLKGVEFRMHDTVRSMYGDGKGSFITPDVLFYSIKINPQREITIVRNGNEKPYNGKLIGAISEEIVQGTFNGITGLLNAIGPAAALKDITVHQTPNMDNYGRIITLPVFRKLLRYLSPYIEPQSQLFSLRMQADNTPAFSLEGKVIQIIRE